MNLLELSLIAWEHWKMNEDHQLILSSFHARAHDFAIFMEGVAALFQRHPKIAFGNFPIVHSIKQRIKSDDHLLKKIIRKQSPERPIAPENCFQEITDYAGVRVLHLRQDDFKTIKEVIDEKIASGDWCLIERPVAYTWDPEYEQFFLNLGCSCERKESFYTSVHFTVRPRADSPLSCEIQVRTLFEEIWGEIDHQINYPQSTKSVTCHEQLRVLAKVVGAGSRLVTSIYNSNRVTDGLPSPAAQGAIL
jgi:ppGpp synthetase/RelA/SpoT-type nucleotidyltranferase